MKLELGNTLIELCKTVPSGVVVFFTSYKQEAAFYDLWQKNGLLQKLEAQKTIFREPKKTSDVESTLLMNFLKNTDDLFVQGEPYYLQSSVEKYLKVSISLGNFAEL